MEGGGVDAVFLGYIAKFCCRITTVPCVIIPVFPWRNFTDGVKEKSTPSLL